MAARSLGIVYTGIYDAWSVYDANADPARSSITRRPAPQRTDANREAAINRVAYRLLIDQFVPSVNPTQAEKDAEDLIKAKLVSLSGNPADNSLNINTGVGVGNKTADELLAFYHADNSNQLNKYENNVYLPKNKPIRVAFPTLFEEIDDCSKWQPLSYYNPDSEMPAVPKFIAPHWGSVKAFALPTGDHFRPSAPQNILSQGFLDQAKHVIEVQANLTVEQKVIAEYWADGPKSELPPGHWCLFTAFVVGKDPVFYDLEKSVKIFFAVSNAIADAAIATWDAKAEYDYVRPITAIRHLFRGKWVKGWGGPGMGTVELKGEFWRPFQTSTFPTPPFAEFTSGHSGFSMAAATVLRLFTDSDKFGYYTTQTKPLAADPNEPVVGITMGWNTFTEAASEAGESRLYGGIHFYEGNVVGLDLGKKVGELVYNKCLALWS